MSLDTEKGVLKVNPKTILMWLGIVIPVWGMLTASVIFYNDIMFKSKTDLSIYVKKADHTAEHAAEIAKEDFEKLEAKIERTEILIAIYARDVGGLSEQDKNDYELAKSRLGRLQAQRDAKTGVRN